MGIYASIYARQNGEPHDPLSVLPRSAFAVFVANASGPFDVSVDPMAEPPVMIEVGPYNSIKAVPLDENGVPRRDVMFGGRYIGCSDSRFGDLCELLLGHRFYGAVALHDRCEGRG
jgi:hypothetical protein